MVNALLWDGVFQGRFEDRAFAIDLFNKHIESVKSIVPPDKLLVYRVTDGWEPLCDFLSVPLPDKPFPHLNDRARMRQFFAVLRSIDLIAAVIAVGMLIFLLKRARRK